MLLSRRGVLVPAKPDDLRLLTAIDCMARDDDMRPPSHGVCCVAMKLAAMGAVKRARNGTPSPDFQREVHQSRLNSCFERGWVNVGKDKERAERDNTDKPMIYLTAKGLRQVKRWLREGVDASDTDMSPEWRARLRYRYG